MTNKKSLKYWVGKRMKKQLLFDFISCQHHILSDIRRGDAVRFVEFATLLQHNPWHIYYWHLVTAGFIYILFHHSEGPFYIFFTGLELVQLLCRQSLLKTFYYRISIRSILGYYFFLNYAEHIFAICVPSCSRFSTLVIHAILTRNVAYLSYGFVSFHIFESSLLVSLLLCWQFLSVSDPYSLSCSCLGHR